MWYYASAGDYEGPFQEAYLGRKLRAGVLTRDTLVWRNGMAAWLPLGETELAQLLLQANPWQEPPIAPPTAPQIDPSIAQPTERPSRSTRRASLEDYKQSGYEQTQQALPPISKATRCNRPKGRWQNLSILTAAVSWLCAISAMASTLLLLSHFLIGEPVLDGFQLEWGGLLSIQRIESYCRVLGTFAFFVWLVRAISNLDILKANYTNLVGGWVVISFFIPFVRLLVPYLALRKLWRASFAPESWTKEPVAPLVTFMWLAWIVSRQAWTFNNLTWDTGSFPLERFVSPFDPQLNLQIRLAIPILLKIISDVTIILFVRAIWRAQLASRSEA